MDSLYHLRYYSNMIYSFSRSVSRGIKKMPVQQKREHVKVLILKSDKSLFGATLYKWMIINIICGEWNAAHTYIRIACCGAIFKIILQFFDRRSAHSITVRLPRMRLLFSNPHNRFTLKRRSVREVHVRQAALLINKHLIISIL